MFEGFLLFEMFEGFEVPITIGIEEFRSFAILPFVLIKYSKFCISAIRIRSKVCNRNLDIPIVIWTELKKFPTKPLRSKSRLVNFVTLWDQIIYQQNALIL